MSATEMDAVERERLAYLETLVRILKKNDPHALSMAQYDCRRCTFCGGWRFDHIQIGNELHCSKSVRGKARFVR